MDLPINYTLATPTERRQARDTYKYRQKGLCAHCGEPLSGPPPKVILNKKINWKYFPKNFLKYPVHLHHSHDTGMTIGAVHAYCNAVLWQYHGE
jgi:hypothetical protein